MDDPSLNADGWLIAYAALRTGTSVSDIYVEDRAAGTVARIGENIPNGSSGGPLLSADGRYVVFSSKASNYVANDDNGAQDVFLHDRYRGVTYRLSAGSARSSGHIISRDGRTVVFQSFAGDLSPGDYNEALDIFAVTIGKRYVIQSRQLLNAAGWTNASEPILASSSVMSLELASAETASFYRAVLAH